MAKRGNNEGSIYKRTDGRWAAALTVTGGKRRTLYGKTRQEVARKLNGALRDREASLPVIPERQTMEQFLGQWLKTAEPTIRRTTFVRYEEYMRLLKAWVQGDKALDSPVTPDTEALERVRAAHAAVQSFRSRYGLDSEAVREPQIMAERAR